MAAYAGVDLRSEVYLGTWTTVPVTGPGSVRNATGVAISRGRPNQAATMSPSSAAFTVDNRDCRWTIRNPLSPWYGQLVQNSPVRFSVPSSLTGIGCYLRLETDQASYASAPDAALGVVHVTTGVAAAASSLAVTIPATTAGNLLAVYVYVGGDASLQTVSALTLGASGLTNAKATNNGAFVDSEIWYLAGITAGQTTVTVTATGTSEIAAAVYEIAGAAASPLDQTQSHVTAASTSWTSNATATLAQASEIAIGGVGGPFGGAGATITGPASPWVNTSTIAIGGTLKNVAMAGYNIVSATTGLAYAGTASAAGNSVGVIATFKQAAGNNLGITSGTLSVRVDCKITDWTGNHILAAKEGSNGNAWALYTNGNGTIAFNHYDAAAGIHINSSTLPVPYFGARMAIRADYNIGAQTITFYTAPTMAGSWTQLGSVVTTAATTQAAAAGQPVQVGNGQNNTLGLFGEVYEAQLLATGVLEADPVFTSQTPGVTSFADAQANTWTVAGTAELSGRAYRFHGELAALPRAAAPNSADAYSAAQAGGLSRRLSQQQTPADSAMKRAHVRLPASLQLAAYWPGEDAAGATQIGQAVGRFPMGSSGLTMSSFTGFLSSAALPVMNGGTATALVDPNSVTWTDNVVRFLLAVPAGDDTNNAIICRIYTQGTVTRIDVRYGTGGGLQMLGYNAVGAAVFTGTIWGFGLPTLAGCRVSVELLGNGHYNIWALTPDGIAHGGGSTWAGTLGAVTGVAFGGGLVTSAMGHFSVQGVSDPITDLFQALNAWQGETAGARFTRLCSEESIPCRITGPPDVSQPMGAQTQQTIIQLLQEVENTDQGLMTEPRQVLGLGYVTNRGLCQQPPMVTADYSLAQIDVPFSPASDDTLAVNDVTMTAADGSTARQVLPAGPMSVNAPPSGVGRFDTTITVNPQNDAQLSSLAGWYLHIRSADEDRYPVLPFQLARGNIPQAVPLLDIGNYLQVINTPSWVAPPPVKQLVAGYTETIGPQPRWQITFNGIPETPYETAILDDPVFGHLDTAGSQLSTGVNTSATSWSVATTLGPLWTTSAGDFPFDWKIAGEQVTVTNITGASSPQTATVTRSVNGVVKSHSAGEAISLAHPMILAL